MDPTNGFGISLGLTLLLLALVVVTGLRARVRLHVSLVVLAVVSLGVTIYYAEQLGRLYDLESAGAITPIHLWLAKATTLAYLLPVVTGVRTLRDRSRRRTHFRVAMFTLALTVITAVTGTLMLLLAERLPG